MKVRLMALGLALFSNLALADQENYKIDDSHSFANWTIRHVASKTAGTFNDITGTIFIDRNNLENSSVNARINMLSVNSGHAKRDDHIKKEDYLDAYKFGEMHFVSSKVEAKGADEGILTGKLSLHGVTKEISFPFKVLGFGDDPWGGYRMGIEAHTSLKASDYGFTWPLKPNASVGDDIEIALLIEGVRFYPDAKPIPAK
ncbi:MAG TPA: YceI family protein [Methylophilaceae bacterium]|nr:YceI family protein [Methylophilaceae bacterium]